jgi:F-type H+-transporting ATPase subunit b
MELDWTTFALEILNFLVLVWILSRLLYRPVTNAIARRKAGIEKTLADTQAAAAEARALRGQYEDRMRVWQQEVTQAHAQLRDEIAADRTRLMSEVHAALEQERDKARAVERQHSAELQRRLQAQARADGASFVARLLRRMASAELENRIHALVLEDLPQLAKPELQAVRAACLDSGAKMKVTTAYPLDAAQRSDLEQALGRVTESAVRFEFVEDPALMAGLRASVGPWVLRSNLRDELAFFSEAYHADR